MQDDRKTTQILIVLIIVIFTLIMAARVVHGHPPGDGSMADGHGRESNYLELAGEKKFFHGQAPAGEVYHKHFRLADNDCRDVWVNQGELKPVVCESGRARVVFGTIWFRKGRVIADEITSPVNPVTPPVNPVTPEVSKPPVQVENDDESEADDDDMVRQTPRHSHSHNPHEASGEHWHNPYAHRHDGYGLHTHNTSYSHTHGVSVEIDGDDDTPDPETVEETDDAVIGPHTHSNPNGYLGFYEGTHTHGGRTHTHVVGRDPKEKPKPPVEQIEIEHVPDETVQETDDVADTPPELIITYCPPVVVETITTAACDGGYEIQLRRGGNTVSLPFPVEGIETASDFVERIDGGVSYYHGVGLHTFHSAGLTTPVRDITLTPDRGFYITMQREEVVCFPYPQNVNDQITAEMTIEHGYGVYGVPVDSDELETVGDFYRVFDAVWLIYMLDEKGRGRYAYNNDETKINGHTAYFIHAKATEAVELTGRVWQYNPPAAPAKPRPNLTVLWGAIKRIRLER